MINGNPCTGTGMHFHFKNARRGWCCYFFFNCSRDDFQCWTSTSNYIVLLVKMDNIYSLVNMGTFFADVLNITHSCYASTFQCSIIKPPLVLWIYMIFPYLYGINSILLLGYIDLYLLVFYIYTLGCYVE